MPELSISPPVHFPQPLNELIIRAPLGDLGRGKSNREFSRSIEELEKSPAKFGLTRNDPQYLAPLRAALWLLANELDRSHEISQSIDTPEGSFWHAIMHRREGDYWNSGWWMKKISKHPVISQIQGIHPNYQPLKYIDQVEACVTRGTGDQADLLKIQWSEWQCLFAYSL